ncbi:hypothetical protein Ct61P_15137 [Colletotrichum tofieldiae]|nr:hypothetical protein Ct61P_15137 [Colletotrichum tofieldiae]
MVRFAVKIPPGRRGHDDDDDDNIVNNKVPAPHSLQLSELCFHQGFAANTAQPISLHFSSSDAGPGRRPRSVIARFQSPLVYPTPTPPYYVHEMRPIMDLTVAVWTSSSEDKDVASLELNTPSSTRSSKATDEVTDPDLGGNRQDATTCESKPTPLLWCLIPPPIFRFFFFLVQILVFLALALAAAAAVAAAVILLGPPPPPSPPPRPPIFTSPGGTPFTVRFTNTTKSLSLHQYALKIQLMRLSSVQPLLEFAARHNDPPLSELSRLASSVCHNASLVVRSRSRGPKPQDLDMACAVLESHISSALSVWNALGPEMLYTWPHDAVALLRRVKWAISNVPEGTFRALLASIRANSSIPTIPAGSAHANSGPSSTSFSNPFDVPPKEWHFVCEPALLALLWGKEQGEGISDPFADAVAETLEAWAARQSRRQAKTMRDPARDHDDDDDDSGDPYPHT